MFNIISNETYPPKQINQGATGLECLINLQRNPRAETNQSEPCRFESLINTTKNTHNLQHIDQDAT